MAFHIVDTHCLIWHFTQDASLSERVRSILRDADEGKEGVLVPSIVLIEFVYLAERHRIPRGLVARILGLVGDPESAYRMAPLDLEVARRVPLVDRKCVADLPDRVVAATALVYECPVLTCDARLRALPNIQTVW